MGVPGCAQSCSQQCVCKSSYVVGALLPVTPLIQRVWGAAQPRMRPHDEALWRQPFASVKQLLAAPGHTSRRKAHASRQRHASQPCGFAYHSDTCGPGCLPVVPWQLQSCC